MCKALNKDLEERKIDSWWQWIYNFVRNWQRKSDEAKNPIPPNFFLCQLVNLLRSEEENDKQNIFSSTKSHFSNPFLCLHVYSFKEKNEGNFRVTACMIKTRSLSKWSHLLEISKGVTIRFKIWSNTQHQCFWKKDIWVTSGH